MQKALGRKTCLAGPSGDSGGDGPLTHGPAGGWQVMGDILQLVRCGIEKATLIVGT